MRAQILACLILAILATFGVRATAAAAELVTFDSEPLIVGQIQQRQARERGETPANAPDVPVEGYLSQSHGRADDGLGLCLARGGQLFHPRHQGLL